MPDGFEEYAAARWPQLVRAALLLGAPAALAPAVATDALARLRRDWRRLASAGDLDGEALDRVVDAWRRRRSSAWWADDPAEPAPAGLEVLDGLDRAERERVAVAAGRPDAEEGPGEGDVLDAEQWRRARSLPVPAPPPGPAALRAADRDRRTRAARRSVVGALVVAAVVAVALTAKILWPEEPPGRASYPRRIAAVDVVRGPEAWVTWYADGRLHLGGASLDLPGVAAVTAVPGGAVYVDRRGDVVRVESSGARVLLGHADAARGLVASTDGELVGWSDTASTGGERTQVLVVVDSADGSRRRTLPVPRGGQAVPVGLTADRMYVAADSRGYVWHLGEDGVRRIGPDGLRRVTNRLALFDPAPGETSVRVAYLDPFDALPPPVSWIEAGGEEAVISPTGHLVLARSTGGDVRLTALAPARALPTGLDPSEVALAVALGPADQVAYLVARREDRPESGEYVRSSFTGSTTLRTCTVSLEREATECTDHAEFSGTGEAPLLAR